MAADEITTTTNPLERLRAKQIRFVHEYLIDRNATAAYQRAGYVANRAAAGRNAYRLLKNADIQAALKRAEDELLERVRLRQFEIHGALRIVGLSNIDDYKVDANGNVAVAEGVDPLAMRAVSSIQHKTTTRTHGEDTETTHDVKITLWNKNEAIRMAAQTHGMFAPEKTDDAQQQPHTNYFLTLIQLAQKNGITSTKGAEGFRSVRNVNGDDAPLVTNGANGKDHDTNGHTRK